MKIKNTLLILLFSTFFFNLSYSQACTTNDECTGLEIPSCVQEYTCNLELGQCEPIMKECENGVPCTEYCVDDEATCETRRCIASDNPITDSTCSKGYFTDCPEAETHCHISYCDPVKGGCVQQNFTCDDEDGCTIDTCNPETGCIFTRRENCVDCFDYGCITDDACFPSVCYLFDGQGNPYPWIPGEATDRQTRDGNPYSECREVPVNCSTNDPCLFSYCRNGECIFEDICSSENPTTTGTVTTTGITTTIVTTTITGETITGETITGETTDYTITGQTIDYTITGPNTIHHTFIGGHTHGHTIHHSIGHTHGHSIHHSIGHSSSIHNTIQNTIHQTISLSTTGNSEEYVGPKYPNCLNCEDLNCESMGRRCKYLKSIESTCLEDDNNNNKYHKDKNHNNHQQQQQHNNNNNKHNNKHNNKQQDNINNQHRHKNNNHFNIKIEEDGGFGGIIKNNQKKYPRKLSHDDCCPYTPTCY